MHLLRKCVQECGLQSSSQALEAVTLNCSILFSPFLYCEETHNKEMEKREGHLHLLFRVEQIQRQRAAAQVRPKESSCSLAKIIGGSYSGRKVIKEGQRQL